MAMHFFTVPVSASKEAEAEINQFIAQNKVINIEKHFVPDGINSFWPICITTTLSDKKSLQTKNRSKQKVIDYKQILSPNDFALYSELRVLRKKLSDEEGIPAYAVFTNEQLSKLVTTNVQTKADLLSIEGIGQSRVDKYADQFIACLKK